jgi:hypothetical protein
MEFFTDIIVPVFQYSIIPTSSHPEVVLTITATDSINKKAPFHNTIVRTALKFLRGSVIS